MHDGKHIPISVHEFEHRQCKLQEHKYDCAIFNEAVWRQQHLRKSSCLLDSRNAVWLMGIDKSYGMIIPGVLLSCPFTFEEQTCSFEQVYTGFSVGKILRPLAKLSWVLMDIVSQLGLYKSSNRRQSNCTRIPYLYIYIDCVYIYIYNIIIYIYGK